MNTERAALPDQSVQEHRGLAGQVSSSTKNSWNSSTTSRILGSGEACDLAIAFRS